MPKFNMIIGIPGSGKTTFCKRFFKNVVYLSSDNMRVAMFGFEDQTHNGDVFTRMKAETLEALKHGRDVVYDATNLNAKRRRKYLKTIEPEHRKVCLFFLTDIDICKERNKLRDRTVSDEVIDKMYRSIQIPQYSEGWNEIRIIPCFDDRKNYNISETMDRLIEIPHDNPHHTLSIGNHICAATKYIIDNYSLKFAGDIERLEVLTEAMFYHDIGKEYTKSFVDSHDKVTDIAHYYGHEYISAYLYFLYKFKKYSEENKMSEEEWKKELKRIFYVAYLIENHMSLNSNHTEKFLLGAKNKFGKETFENLCIINEADKVCG